MLGVVLLAVLVARGRGSPGTVAVSVSAGSVSTVVFHGPPGQLSTTGAPGAAAGQVTLTGQMHWVPGHRAAVAIGPRQSGHVLRLGYRCAQITSGELELVTR